jgi:hypothetical protein
MNTFTAKVMNLMDFIIELRSEDFFWLQLPFRRLGVILSI